MSESLLCGSRPVRKYVQYRKQNLLSRFKLLSLFTDEIGSLRRFSKTSGHGNL